MYQMCTHYGIINYIFNVHTDVYKPYHFFIV